ncbi:NACHT domain-containing protein [Campylobacter coli]|uniref:NACHT domain-containing protein n=1 Tax=Campylobacter coli TaxID=195 RepID=UPI001F3759D2|nr:NACHT domain-containing protein [Campylobacter coli]
MQEDLYTEFKIELKWMELSENNREVQQGQDELIKDIVALFNTINFKKPKQFIIGIDDEGVKKSHKWKSYERLQDQFNFKKWLIGIIKNNFVPDYCNEKDETKEFKIEDFIQLQQENDLFYIIIEQAPFLLKSIKQSSKFLENEYYVRVVKTNSQNLEPEISRMSSRQIEEEKNKLAVKFKARFFAAKSKDLSINKIVEYYKKTTYPKGKIESIKDCPEKSLLYILTYNNAITMFMYISKYSTQERTIEFLKEQQIIQNAEKIFVLYDEKNKSGGYTDKKHIQKLINKYLKNKDKVELSTILEWVKNNCEALKNRDKLKIPPNPDFIYPYIKEHQEENEVEAISFLEEWIDEEGSPVLIIEGSGGIGKTTLFRKFLLELNSDKAFVFITSETIKRHIQNYQKLDNINLINIIEQEVNNGQHIEEDSLELELSAGKLFIVLDGLDEIMNIFKNKINADEFFEFINSNNEKFFKTKILISCRTTQWITEKIDIIRKVNLIEFNEKQVREYFKEDKKLLNIAKEYSKDEKFIPYILNIIKNNFIYDNKINDEEMPKYLLESNIDDKIIFRICKREKVRQKNDLINKGIDEQINIFIKIAIDFGDITAKNIQKIATAFNFSEDSILSHPILMKCENEQRYSFRYEFWIKKFQLLGLVKKIIESNDINNLMYDDDFRKSFNGSDIKELSQYFTKSDQLESFKIYFYEWIHDTNKGYLSNKDNNKEFNANFFLFLLLISKGDRTDRTKLLEELYEKNGVITNLCIVNFIDQNPKLTFNFGGKKIINCIFENYEYFLNCTFDENSCFESTSFKNVVYKATNKDFLKCVFKNGCDMDNEIKSHLSLNNHKEITIRDKLYNFLSHFYTGIGSTKKSKDFISNLKQDEILNFLIDENILKEDEKDYYSISESYHNIIEMFDDENKNNPIFVKIVEEYGKIK